jgi:hypothetical protein
MKRLLIAAALFWQVCGAHAESLWVAEARVIAVTSACAGTVAVSDFFRAIYRPRGASIGNGANSHLTLFSQRSSFWMRVPNNDFRFGVNYTGYVVSNAVSFSSHAGGVLDWQESAPFGSPVASNVTASIANFFGKKTCTATLRMPFVPLP